ncbi:MAG TPA: IPTL-CTERM sorting domain-containing protein [Casimicrobiaceae bacterium]|nr:IPTL-CTERM sorting domain-containing protein [Casimicrobiaceae bacterium]
MKTRIAVAALLAGLWSAGAQALLITDPSDWSSGWTFSSFASGAGTATAVVEGTGGNPGARLNVTTVTPTPADVAFGTAVLTTTTTPAPVAGAVFTMTLDVLSGAGGFGQGQGIELLVQQSGSVYGMGVGITGFPLNSFTTLPFNGTFTAANFTKISGAGPAQPVFDGATPTQYGFAAGNSNSATLTQYYDNFTLSIPSIGAPPPGPLAAVPTLGFWSMLLLGGLLAAAGVAAAKRRR